MSNKVWLTPDDHRFLQEEFARNMEQYESAASFLQRKLALWAEHAWGSKFAGASLRAISAHTQKLESSAVTCADGVCSLAGMASGVHAMNEYAIKSLMERFGYSEQQARDAFAWIMSDPPG